MNHETFQTSAKRYSSVNPFFNVMSQFNFDPLPPRSQISKTKSFFNTMGFICNQFSKQSGNFFSSTPNICAQKFSSYQPNIHFTWKPIRCDENHQHTPWSNVVCFQDTEQNQDTHKKLLNLPMLKSFALNNISFWTKNKASRPLSTKNWNVRNSLSIVVISQTHRLASQERLSPRAGTSVFIDLIPITPSGEQWF